MSTDMLVDPGVQQAAEDALRKERERKAQQEKTDLIKRVRNAVAQSYQHDKKARERYVKDRKVAAGVSQWDVNANLVGTIIEILLAFIYAKDPDISASVADSVGESRAKQYRDVTRTLEIVVSRLLRDAGLKRKAKRWVRSALTVGAGWLRATMQTRTEKDPVVQNELNDLQQQLAQITVLQAEIADNGACNTDLKKQELEVAITALEAKLERQIATGLVLEVIAADDVQVAAECGELESYLDSPWIRLRFYKTRDEVLALTGWDERDLQGANTYYQRPRADTEGQAATTGQGKQTEWALVTSADAETAVGFLMVEEVQHKRDGVVYTMIDGINDKWAREPYAPRQSSRFYDVFLLAFHYVDGERHPHSLAGRLASLAEEYARTRSNFAEHRKRAIPGMIFDKGALDETEVTRIMAAAAQEWVGVDFKGDDIRKSITEKSYAQFDPRLYDTTQITTEMEKISGAQDAMQSGVQIEKTATEAEIQNNGFGARTGVQRDESEDVLSELAMHVAQLALQTVDTDLAVRLAGDEAVWPELTVDEVLCAFAIAVKAGSTGKPNTAAQRNAWQALLPLLEKTMTVIGNFRTQPGMAWAAEPYVELLKETARVVDFKGDVDKLIPAPPPGWAPPMPAGAPGAAGMDGAPAPPGPLAAALGGDAPASAGP